jgi:hypothetical protein
LLNSNLANGILVDNGATGTLVVRNRAIGNGDDGIDVDAPATTLTHNIANHNHDLGIEAVPGVIDGGGNTPRPTVTLCSARILTVNSGQVASGGLPGTILLAASAKESDVRSGRRATGVPHRMDNLGTQRTTTVTRAPPMSWAVFARPA